jgi:ubiquinone/menaquinone biosynthesis C-methylase UbiE
MSLRHWTDPPAGIAEISRVLTRDGLFVLADVLPSRRRRRSRLALPMLRRGHADIPAELSAVLAAHHLAVVGTDHTCWFSLPDVQVIAARQSP